MQLVSISEHGRKGSLPFKSVIHVLTEIKEQTLHSDLFKKLLTHSLRYNKKKIITCKLLRFLFNSSSFLYDFCYATRNYHALSKTSNLWVCSSALISRQLSNWIKKQKCIQKIYKIYPN